MCGKYKGFVQISHFLNRWSNYPCSCRSCSIYFLRTGVHGSHPIYQRICIHQGVMCVCGSKIAVTLGVVSPCDYPRARGQEKQSENAWSKGNWRDGKQRQIIGLYIDRTSQFGVAPSTSPDRDPWFTLNIPKNLHPPGVLCVCGSKIAVTLGVVSPCDYPGDRGKGKKLWNCSGWSSWRNWKQKENQGKS